MLQPNFRKVAFVFDRSISIAFKSGLYGGRYVPRGCNWGTPYFNSRPSARGDVHPDGRRAAKRISIPAPPRGATKQIVTDFNAGVFQFTPLREGRPDTQSMRMPIPTVSIPAPPRGATSWELSAFRAYEFQFPPLREGRQQKICNFCKSFVQPSQITAL